MQFKKLLGPLSLLALILPLATITGATPSTPALEFPEGAVVDQLLTVNRANPITTLEGLESDAELEEATLDVVDFRGTSDDPNDMNALADFMDLRGWLLVAVDAEQPSYRYVVDDEGTYWRICEAIVRLVYDDEDGKEFHVELLTRVEL